MRWRGDTTGDRRCILRRRRTRRCHARRVSYGDAAAQEPRRAPSSRRRRSRRQREERGLLRLPERRMRRRAGIFAQGSSAGLGRRGYCRHGQGDDRRAGAGFLRRQTRRHTTLAETGVPSADGPVRPLPRRPARRRHVQGQPDVDDVHPPVRRRLCGRHNGRRRPADDQQRRNRLRRMPSGARWQLDFQDGRRLPHLAGDARTPRRSRRLRRCRRVELRFRQHVPGNPHGVSVG